jgi:uncharacterized protein YjiS (DUF1127 family)
MDQIRYASISAHAIRPKSRLDRNRGTSIAAQLVDLLATWHQRRRGRAELAGMPDGMLKDIGLSRGDAEHEWEKPFWRD